MKDLINRKIINENYVTASMGGGVITKSDKIYCSIFCNTDSNLIKDTYTKIPYGNKFTENIGGFRLDTVNAIIVPNDGIYLITMNGCFSPKSSSATGTIITYIQQLNENIADGKSISQFKMNSTNGLYYYLNQTTILDVKANDGINYFYSTDIDGLVFRASIYPSKISVIKLI